MNLTVIVVPLTATAAEESGENSEAGDSETVTLSAFDIDATKDDRYRATNTVSATGLNTPIIDLPMTIQVVTNEFINDLGATDFEESLAYTPGVNTSEHEIAAGRSGARANRRDARAEQSSSASQSRGLFNNTVEVRGFNAPFQNRLGFRYGGVVVTRTHNIALGGIFDSVNTDRIEVVKGPNSLLYGVGVISGIANVIPKKPLSYHRRAFSISSGSFGFLRATGDLTGPILRPTDANPHGLNYRFLGALEQRGHWTDHRTKDHKYGAFQLDYAYDTSMSLFAEVQLSDTRFNGTGPQWIYDNLAEASDTLFKNPYDEQHNFAQDGPVAGLDKVVFGLGARGRKVLLFEEPESNDRLFTGGTLPNTTRLTGPDTYEQRKESNLLIDLSLHPSEYWTISAGIFMTHATEEELAVNVQNFSNRDDRFDVRKYLPLYYEDLENNEFAHLLYARKNPYAEPYASDFDPTLVQGFDDIKIGRYWWSLRPQDTESRQVRLRSAFRFETPFVLGTRTENAFHLGYQYVNDAVDFLVGTEPCSRAHLDRKHPYIKSGRVAAQDAAKMDGLYFRGIDDFSVMHYEGENLVMPGSAYLSQDILFHGAYAILQSRFWENRLGLLLGLRYDRYNAETRELYRVSPEDEDIGVNDRLFVDNPFSIVYGQSEVRRSFDQDVEAWSKNLAISYAVNPAINLYGLYAEGLSPNTVLVDGNNQVIPAEATRSIEAGIKWSAENGVFSGSLAVFESRRENAIWNFSLAPAPSRWRGSPTHPVGYPVTERAFNPEPNNGLLISYQIHADFIAEEVRNLFGKGLVHQSINEPGRNRGWFIEDPVTRKLTRLYGLFDIRTIGGNGSAYGRNSYWALEYPSLDHKQSFTVHVEDPEGTVAHQGRAYSLKTIKVNWRGYIEEAFSRRDMSGEIPGSIAPIRYDKVVELTPVNSIGNSPSASPAGGAACVTYEDKATGLDLEFVYSPIPNLQVVFNYAHVERHPVSAFEMVNWIDLNTGKAYGTEYDRIYQILGREAGGITGSDTDGDGVHDRFVDIRGNEITTGNPARPSDFIGGLEDLSLHFNPEDEASIWSRYTFAEGPLTKLGLAFGIRYYGPAQTSVPIGGRDLADNLFRTPDAPERWRFDSAFYYDLSWLGADWRLSLNIYNLTDQTESLVLNDITDPYTGTTATKRTRILHTPRSYRIGVSVRF